MDAAARPDQSLPAIFGRFLKFGLLAWGGPVAQIAMIRIKATGQKIGSLVINPGGPGESGIEAALGVVQSLPQLSKRSDDQRAREWRRCDRAQPLLRKHRC